MPTIKSRTTPPDLRTAEEIGREIAGDNPALAAAITSAVRDAYNRGAVDGMRLMREELRD